MTSRQNMHIQTAHQRQRLERAGHALGLNLDERQITQMLQLLQELMRWNKTYNLTAIRDSDQALVHHLFDSLSVVKPLQDHLHQTGKTSPRIMDVGSGAGLPGVVLAIAMPDVHVTCIDAVEKKISFIRMMKGVLGLKNLDGLHARVEDMQANPSDMVISRAFASIKDFVLLAGKHLTPNGHIVAMKGKEPVDEMQDMSEDREWKIAKTERLNVPELEAERCLVWIEKKGNT